MRLLPISLFGRLVLTFVSGLLLTILVTVAVQTPERDVIAFRVSALRGAQQLADLVGMLERLPEAQRDVLVDHARAQGVNLTLAHRGAGAIEPVPGTNAAAFRDLLQETLGNERPLSIDVRNTELPPAAPDQAPRPGYRFDVNVRLNDGTWAGFEFSAVRRLRRWPSSTVMSMSTLALAMTLLSFLAVRWVTRPLKVLTEAADKMGADINQPLMRESGPQEVRRAARAFNAMQERLTRYVRTRTGILTAMSHDLKTPITRLRLRAELLDDAELRDKFGRDLIEMERMVGTTLDYMRGLDSDEPPQPIDVQAMVAAMQADAEEYGHAIKIEGVVDRPYLGKPAGLRRCLQNLVDNALRYGKDVSICIEDRVAQLAVSVRDRGPGIPAAELERVFEPFVRLEASRNASTGGTGLGLSIARNLAQSMGGDVRLRNREQGGLEARLTLPRS